ncbi:MAG: sensor domain-containing diguanylate cyclase, partial [Actinobacteria bacterium]|nr:sensor domain-containing diguanylate cyclase [Actinomycetota bacterium]
MRGFSALIRRAAKAVPGGVTLSPADWEQRHRWISGLLWFHVPVIVGFGLIRGNGALHSIAEGGPVAAMGLLSAHRRYARQLRSALAGLGLMISSAVLVHLSGGNIEMHFHFFVMLSVISLYQDWRPFLVSIAFVATHHAVMGTIRPHDVFDHSSAWNSPLKWAAIHAFFVLASCAASVVSWRIVEDSHRRSKAALEDGERHFRALIEHSTDVVTVVDAEGNISYDSPSSVQVLGYSNEERVGSNGLDYVHPDDLPRSAQVLKQVVTRGGTVVTLLANRALLLDRIEHARESARRRPGSRLALLYIDLDDFKTVNDGLGHEAGDELLRRTAERIALAIRPGDTAARLGGDEFAILLEDIPAPALAYEIGA